MKEHELLDIFIKHLQSKYDAKVWVEVPVAGVGTADVVWLMQFAGRDRYFVAEGKATKLSYALMAQALRWNTLCAKPFVVVPPSPLSDEKIIASNHFHKEGVIVASVGDSVSFNTVFIPNPHDGISEFVRDSQLYGGQFAKAGTAGGRRGTKANEEYAGIESYVAQNHGCSAAEAAREGGMKASTLLKLIKQGKVRLAVQVSGGKSYLTTL